MSGFQNAGWLSRLWSLAKPGSPIAELITNVQLVQDRSWSSSREHAPYAMHAGILSPAGAGVHNFVEIGGTDSLAPTLNLLHYGRLELTQSNTLTGLVSVVLQDGAGITTATRAAVTPIVRDADPDVAVTIFEGTIATANIPAAVEALPKSGVVGLTAATPSFPNAITEIPPLKGLPFAISWLGPRNLMLFSGADELMIYVLSWQAQRA